MIKVDPVCDVPLTVIINGSSLASAKQLCSNRTILTVAKLLIEIRNIISVLHVRRVYETMTISPNEHFSAFNRWLNKDSHNTTTCVTCDLKELCK